jgi:hypothetical protein
MIGEVAILISLLIYLTFFGWLGWRRGFSRELTVAIIALLSWLLLQQSGDIVVAMANLIAAGLQFAFAGGFTGSADEAFAALTSAPELVGADTRDAFLYVVWVIVFIVAYLATGWIIADKKSEKNGWAIVLGVLNGFFFAMVFLPSLDALFSPEGTTTELDTGINLLSMMGRGARLLWDVVVAIWGLIAPLGSVGILIVLTAILVIAAMSIRGGAKAKS